MSKFIKVNSGVINLDCIVSVSYKYESEMIYSVSIALSDGSSVSLELFKKELERLLKHCPVVESFDGKESPFV